MKAGIKELIASARASADTQGLRADPTACLLADEIERLDKIINTPEFYDFPKAVSLEAIHQVERWASEHDAGKKPEDWFWLVGYLAGKALHSAKMGDAEKAMHHCISTSAALCNWHRHLMSGFSDMRPGIEPPIL